MNSRAFLSVHSWCAVSRRVVCVGGYAPYLVLVVGVQVNAALLRALPVRRNAVVDVRLVDNLGDQLGALIDGARVWRREFAAENGVLAASGNQEAQQRPHTVHCEAEDDNGDEHEYGDAPLHGGGFALCGLLFLGGLRGAAGESSVRVVRRRTARRRGGSRSAASGVGSKVKQATAAEACLVSCQASPSAEEKREGTHKKDTHTPHSNRAVLGPSGPSPRRQSRLATPPWLAVARVHVPRRRRDPSGGFWLPPTANPRLPLWDRPLFTCCLNAAHVANCARTSHCSLAVHLVSSHLRRLAYALLSTQRTLHPSHPRPALPSILGPTYKPRVQAVLPRALIMTTPTCMPPAWPCIFSQAVAWPRASHTPPALFQVSRYPSDNTQCSPTRHADAIPWTSTCDTPNISTQHFWSLPMSLHLL
jgi:hypothetical protein